MGVLGAIANVFGQILAKILEVILFLIQTVFYFLETTISFPLFTDEESFKDKNTGFENSSNLNSIKAFSICFLTSIFFLIIGDILFSLMMAFSEFSGVFAHDIANIKVLSIEENPQNASSSPFEKSKGNASEFIGGIILFLGEIIHAILLIIVELLNLLIKTIFIITFICIIAELLFIVISVLLYILDLYILLRKNIYKIPDTETGLILDISSKDSLILNFILGLLVLPVVSTILVSVLLFLNGTVYKMILTFWILPSGSRIAIPLLNTIISLITTFFSLEEGAGVATRMLIALFWMLIGLSAFRYRLKQDIIIETKHISSPSILDERYNPSDIAFIQNYLLLFLLLFDPFISITLIYALENVVIPL
ncbi:MAG: hypothetical protein ACFFB5_20865 [Promethearchaeota archaeon]